MDINEFNLKWKRHELHPDSWEGRRVAVSKNIPFCKDVLEVGSGKNSMRKLVNCTNFVTSDAIKSEDIDLEIDLNGILPSNLKFDLVVWSGVLEYVNRPGDFISWLSLVSKGFVGSYFPTEGNPMCAKEAASRTMNGWRNHLTLNELYHMAISHGFILVFHEPWEKQAIFSGYPIR